MDCRASPADASAKSSSVVWEKACFNSCGVIAEKRPRSITTLGIGCPTSSNASFDQFSLGIIMPGLSSPRSARRESFWRRATILFSVGILMVFASIRLQRGSLFTAPVLVTGLKINLDYVAPQPDRGDVAETVGGDPQRLALGEFFFLRPGSLQYGVPICSFPRQSGARLLSLLPG